MGGGLPRERGTQNCRSLRLVVHAKWGFTILYFPSSALPHPSPQPTSSSCYSPSLLFDHWSPLPWSLNLCLTLESSILLDTRPKFLAPHSPFRASMKILETHRYYWLRNYTKERGFYTSPPLGHYSESSAERILKAPGAVMHRSCYLNSALDENKNSQSCRHNNQCPWCVTIALGKRNW